MMRGRFGRNHAPESHEGDERYEAMVAVHHPHRSPMGHAIRHLQSRLMAGVLVFLPVFVTYVVFDFFYDLVNALLDPVLGFFRIPRYPGLAFAVAIVILYVMGLLIGWAVAKLLINYVHDVIGRVPVLGPVYNTTRMGIDFLSDTQQQNYRGVVLVEFPRQGVMSIGLITANLGRVDGLEEYVSIYIPTTPVPSSGYLVIVPASKVTPTDITVDEAMRMIISGGILAGDIFSQRSITNHTTWPGRHWLRCSSNEPAGKKQQSPLMTERAHSRQDLVSR